jgi:hypothetical protein
MTEKPEEILRNVARDSEVAGTSSLARAADWVQDHFSGRDALKENSEKDSLELWGKRIGRALSLIGVLVLTWLLGAQLHWW